MKTRFERMKHAAEQKMRKVRFVLTGCFGGNLIDSVIEILIAVMTDTLLLAGLYALFPENVLPTLSWHITEMFNYAG